MELDIKTQQDKLRAEIAKLTGELQQLQQATNNQSVAILKKQGALEMLQELGKEKEDAKHKE